MRIKKTVLIVDDEPDIRELLQITLQRMGLDSSCADDLAGARHCLSKQSFDLCLTDLKLPDGDGLDFVCEIQKEYPSLPVAVITAYGSIDTAIHALKKGAFDFLTKPIDLNTFRTVVTSALNLGLKRQIAQSVLIGQSEVIQTLRNTIDKVSRSQAPVCISGESGTGKELVARMIHELGPRSNRSFVPINCGAIPHDLMESEFFGHKKGSFTGAVSDKDGLFKAADGGTLLLDELAELPQHMQVKLLRAIQEKRIKPVGSEKEIAVDVRILSATNDDLASLVTKKQFRQDLFYRINVIEIKIPPLRERKEDIQLLTQFMLERMMRDRLHELPTLTPEAEQCLADYSFPGNVRELENILERAITLCSSQLIGSDDIQLLSAGAVKTDETASLDTMLDDIEKQKILKALAKTHGNKTAAAKLLGISFRALRYRLDKMNLSQT